MELLYTIFILPIELFYKYVYLACADITGSYGIGLFVLSIISALAFLPLAKMALVSQTKENTFQDIIRPQLAEINEKYSGSSKQAAITRLYKRYAYHPILGIRSAFGVLLQVPFLTGAYYMISALPQIKGQSFLFIHDLSLPDGLLFGINILPIIMTIINIGVVFTTKGLARKDIIQALVIAFFFLVLLYPAPSALLIFWTTNNLFFLIQNLLPARKAKKIKSLKKHGRMYNLIFPAVTAQESNLNRHIYFSSCLALTIMVFLYLPSNLYYSDPVFFGQGFWTILLNIVPYAVGFLGIVSFLWMICHNFLLRRALAYLFLFLFIAALVNMFIIVRDFGVIDVGILSNASKFIGKFTWFRDLFASILLACIILFLCTRSRIKKELPKIIVFFTAPMLIIATYNAISSEEIEISTPIKNTANSEFNDENQNIIIQKVASYSQTEENVVIIIMDMFTGGHIGKMIEDPWFTNFSAGIDGFTWYPDTIATGALTLLSLPSIYGGKSYTPLEINKKGLSLKESINKAYAVLPRNFSKHNYETYMVRGLDSFDMDYMKKYDGINANSHYLRDINFYKQPDAKHFSSDLTIKMKPHLFMLAVSLYSISPNVLKKNIYDRGAWLNTTMGLDAHNARAGASHLTYFYNLFDYNINNSSKKPTLKILYTSLSHAAWNIHKDELVLVKDPYPATEGQMMLVDQIIPEHYYTERHMMKILANYFEKLKELGVYDNTKIILVSDHDKADSQMVANMFENNMKGKHVKLYSAEHSRLPGHPHALLMVKDFNSRGNMKTDNALMAILDVAALATLHLPSVDEFTIEDPRKKTQNRVREYVDGDWIIEHHEKNKYILSEHWQIKGTMFDINNWKKIPVE